MWLGGVAKCPHGLLQLSQSFGATWGRLLDGALHVQEFPTVEVWETYMMRFARRVPEFGVPNQPTGLAGIWARVKRSFVRWPYTT